MKGCNLLIKKNLVSKKNQVGHRTKKQIVTDILRIDNLKGLLAKLVATFLILIIIPIMIIGYISINTSSASLIKKAKESLLNSTLQTENYFEDTLNQFQNGYAMQVRYGLGVADFFKVREHQSIEEETNNLTNAKRTVSDLSSAFSDTFSSIALIKDTGDAICYPTSLSKEMEINTAKWFQEAIKSSKGIWIEEHNEKLPSQYDINYILSYLSTFKLTTDNKAMGLIVLDIKPAAFKDILSSVQVGNNSISYIVTKSNKVINQEGELDKSVRVENNNILQEAVKYAETKDSFVFTKKMGETSYIAAYSKSPTTGWMFITAVPEKEIISVTSSIRNRVIFLGIICGVCTVLIGILVSLSLTLPMKKLMGAMGRAAKGDLRANLYLRRTDEIGALAESFNTMLAQIRSLVSGSKTLADKVNTSSDNISQICTKTSGIMSEVTTAIAEIASGSIEQADEAEKSFCAASKLSDEIEKAIQAVQMMRNVSEHVGKIAGEGIITTSVLNKKAYETNEITTKVVEDISQLNILVKDINKITKILKSISERTKLLSLNALIETSRTGESGKGFAVIADEIRKLAEQTHESSKGIDTLAQQILNQTKLSAELVERAQIVIKDQYSAVKDTSDMFSKINEAIGILNGNMEQVSDEMSAMGVQKVQVVSSIEKSSTVSEEAAAATEEVSASTQEQLAIIHELDEMTRQLKELSQNLNDELGKFYL